MTTGRVWVVEVLAFILGFIITSPIGADWIYLENGSRIQGEVVKKDNGRMHVRIPNGELRIRLSRVKRIEKQADEAYHLDQARKQRGYGNFEGAIEKVRNVLEEQPGSRTARKELKKTYLEAGRTWFREKKILRARALIARAQEEFPESQSLGDLLERIEAHEKDVRDTLAEAKKLHRQEHYLEAIDYYQEVVTRLPGIAHELGSRLSNVYLAAGKLQYRNGNVTAAIDHFERSVQYDPERMSEAKTPWLRSILKRTNRLMDQEQYAAAQDLLRTQLENFPSSKRLKFLHAHSIHLQGDVEKAVEEYGDLLNRNVSSDSPDVSALQKKAAEVSDIQFEQTGSRQYEQVLSGDWRTVKTEHFTIHHRNKPLAERAEKMVERYFERIKKAVQLPDLDWRRRCDIYVYPDRSAYIENASLPGWSAGETRVDRAGGALRSHRILTYQTAPQLFQSVLPHEIAHVMFDRIMNYRSIPLWLKEGVAVHFEYPVKKKHYLMRVRTARSSEKLLALERLMNRRRYPEDEERMDRFYAQSYSLVHFLLQRGDWPALIEFGTSFAESGPVKALEEVYGFSTLDKFRNTWLEQVEEY